MKAQASPSPAGPVGTDGLRVRTTMRSQLFTLGRSCAFHAYFLGRTALAACLAFVALSCSGQADDYGIARAGFNRLPID